MDSQSEKNINQSGAKQHSISVEADVSLEAKRVWQEMKPMLDEVANLENGHILFPSVDPGYPPSIRLENLPVGSSLTPLEIAVQAIKNTDPEAPKIDYHEVAWLQYFVKETPGGSLYSENKLFDAVAKGKPLTLVHATPYLDKILQGDVDDKEKKHKFFASGGCLGASMYTAPLREDRKPHNLVKFVFEEQFPRSPRYPGKADYILFEFQPEKLEKNLIRGVDYLRYGEFQWEVFKELYDTGQIDRNILTDVAVVANRQLTPPVIDMLNMAANYTEETMISPKEFDDVVQNAFKEFPFMGYPYFEAMSEYVSLFQNDTESIRLRDLGELNTYNYFNVAFGLRPQLYDKFRLLMFNPSIKEMADYIEKMANEKHQGILDFDRDQFYAFMMLRSMQNVRKSFGLSKDHRLNKSPLGSKVDAASLLAFAETNKGVVGHLFHRALRSKEEWEDDHRLYEHARAQKIWNYWDKLGVGYPFNGSLPKGEVGYNPRKNTKYKAYRGIIKPDGTLQKGEELPIVISTDMAKESALRPHSGSEKNNG